MKFMYLRINNPKTKNKKVNVKWYKIMHWLRFEPTPTLNIVELSTTGPLAGICFRYTRTPLFSSGFATDITCVLHINNEVWLLI